MIPLANELEALRDSAVNAGCLSDLALDRAVAGEDLDEGQRAHLESCDRCAGLRASRLAEREAFALRALPEAPDRVEPRARPWTRKVAALGGGALAAAAVVVFMVMPTESAERTKGDVALGLFVKRGDVVTKGGPGEQLRPGDELRFTMRLKTRARVAVLSLDGAGLASVYFPTDGRMLEIRDVGEDVPLPLATELDGTLGEERLFGLACAAPVDLAALRASLQATGALTPPAGCSVDEVVVTKR